MEGQNKKEKIKTLAIGLFCLIIMISVLGYTYSYMVVSDQDNSTVKAEVECYTVNYTKGQDISGSLSPGADYTSGQSTDIIMFTEPGCGLMYGTLYITTNQSSTMDFTDNALRYTVVENNVIVAQGAVNGEANQIIYNYFVLNDTETTYQVYIWLDERREEASLADETFSGFIHAEAISASYIDSFVLEESPSISSETATFLSTTITRDKIHSINFIDTDDIQTLMGDETVEPLLNSISENEEIPYFDVSQSKDGSVKLYYKNYTDANGNNLYDIMIGTDTGTTIASSGYYLFSYLTNMESIVLTNLDTSIVTDMYRMFALSYKLEELHLGNFDTSNVTDMSFMFSGNSSIGKMNLKKIYGLENFNTSNVTSMRAMFQQCVNLTELNLSNFDTSKVTDMRHMFRGVLLTSLNLNNFKTKSVTNMQAMFYDCSNLTNIIGLDKFETLQVEDMSYMFYNCTSLESLDLSKFVTSKVEKMDSMFHNCNKLTTLDLSNFNTSNVQDMSFMFNKCSNLITIDLSNFNTINVTKMGRMFQSCSNLKTIYTSDKFVTTGVTDSTYMFYGCTNIVGGNGTTFDSTKIDKTYARIDTPSTPGYFTDIADKPV